jgi:hypothetical protein
MFLYHYFEKERGPFITLSDLSDEKAVEIHDSLEMGENNFAKRNFDGKYMLNRRIIENWLYGAFMKKDGKPERSTPQYMILGESNEPKKWFNSMDYVKIHIDEFNMDTVSFTYGDSFPTFFAPHFGDKSEYRLNVYKYNEILEIIDKYGFPQENPREYLEYME